MNSKNDDQPNEEQHVETVYLSFRALEKPPVDNCVVLVAPDIKELRYPFLATLMLFHTGKAYVLGSSRVNFAVSGVDGSEHIHTALALAVANKDWIKVPPNWPMYTWFQLRSDYSHAMEIGPWRLQQVFRLVTDLNYAQAMGSTPAWYLEDHHQHLFFEDDVSNDEEVDAIIDMFRQPWFENSIKADQCIFRLSKIETGNEHSAAFEQWVADAFSILFSERLVRMQRQPNPGKTLRRDLVATNTGIGPFLHRLLTDYGTRMLMIEVKNYPRPTPTDIRQVRSYLTELAYGDLAILVTHAPDEEIDKATWSQVRTNYYEYEKRKLVWVMPSAFLARLLWVLIWRGRDRVDHEMEIALEDILLKYLPH